jgi:hypothetical protein
MKSAGKPKSPQEILDDIEPMLISEGLMPRTVELPNGDQAELWVTKKELWIVGATSRSKFGWIDPDGQSDDALAKRICGLLAFL